MPSTYSSWMILLLRFSRDSVFKKLNKNGVTSSTISSSNVSVSPHQDLFTVTANNCHTIIALPDDEDTDIDKAAKSNEQVQGESKSDEQVHSKTPQGGSFFALRQSRGRRGSIVTLAAEHSIDSIAAVRNIVNMILAPMVIVPFLDYLTLGTIPRSNTAKPGTADGATAKMGSLKSISQPITLGWTVIFVSHRWWGGKHPDDEKRNLKYGILRRGIEALIKRDNLDPESVGIWIDYACIEQDNDDELQKGVDSLIGYAAQSDYFLIPVYPEADAIKAFVEATHPMELVNYGNRAWCRLEVYVFSCLVEIMGRKITCFAYGLHMPKIKAETEISEALMTTGKSGRGAASTFGGSFVNFFSTNSSKERLVPLFGHNNGALFAKTYMPSSGALTVENDRDTVRGIEQVIQQSYSTMAIKKEVGRLKKQGNEGNLNTSQSSTTTQPSQRRAGSFSKRISRITSKVHVGNQELTEDGIDKRVCVLASKQIHDNDIKVLTKSLAGGSPPPGQVRKLVLRDNMLTDKGVKTLLRDFITAQESGRKIEFLDLEGNPIGPAGAMLFSRLLVDGGGNCALKKLNLASTGLGSAGIVDVASWLGTATQLVELDLGGNGEFGVVAMEALVVAAETHGQLILRVDDAATAGLPRELVARFELACKSNLATNYLAGPGS